MLRGLRIVSITPDPTVPDTMVLIAVDPKGELFYGAISANKLNNLLAAHVDLRRSATAPAPVSGLVSVPA